MEWVKCAKKMPPKDQKFLFHYFYGTGIGEWGQCYSIINGNSERTHEAYILVLWPSEINDGNSPFIWDENYMNEMEVFWMLLPDPPEKKV